ncbi:Non-ribosomal peptide synthetase (fragment) [Xenorhabdus innexi]|uniref:Amino acid adenylation n=1 Tax=Xenorhabdus innexi TaxID=290109 RepID=A0A1N6MVX7_9GAMM
MSNFNANPADLNRLNLEKKIQEQLKSRSRTQQSSVIEPTARDQPLPLSFAQQGLWFLTQLDPKAALAYHQLAVFSLSGKLDYPAFTSALNCLVTRQESLRTRFILIEGQPYQVIDPPDTDFNLSYLDLRQLDETARLKRISELTEQEQQTPFDLTGEPLIRIKLLQLADEEHVLLFTQHHLISDGWSVGIFFRELRTFYHVELNHTAIPNPLPPLSVQYADYAVWQRKWLQGEKLAAQLAFWQKQLQGAPSLLSLPSDRSRPPIQHYTGSKVPIHLTADLLTALKTLGQCQKITLFMILLAGWSIVLSRLSGQDDIVIGTPTANRQHSELENIIGFFVNTLPIRIESGCCNTVTELFAHVRERTLAAYSHQDLPFEQLVEAIQPARSLSYNPIFQVMLTLNNTLPLQTELPGLSVSLIEQEHNHTHFDLKLSFTETEKGLNGYLEFASDLFDRTTAKRMVGYLTNVLTAMTENDAQCLSDLPLMSAAEHQQLLVDFNVTQRVFPQDALIHQLFEMQVQHSPDATAVVFEGHSLSYRELNRQANHLAHYLIAQGVHPDDHVALCTERSLNMIIGVLGILKSGAAYVPLDPTYPTERLAYILADAAPVLLLTQNTVKNRLNCTIPTVILDDFTQSCISPESINDPDIHTLGLTPHHLAYIIYTSGSTGQPKGVMVEHHSVCNYLFWALEYGLTEQQQDGIVSSPLAFDATVTSLYLPILCGGKIHLLRDGQELTELLPLLLSLKSGALVKITPSHFSAIGQELKATGRTCPAHCFVVAGETLPSNTVALWNELSPDSRIINEYGPTETTVGCTIFDTQHPSCFIDNVPIGHPIANTRIYILDQHGEPVPMGVEGELYIGGNGVARGYLNQPELTAERFLPDPFSTIADARLYRTGDLGRWLPDGTIEYLGRNDFQVKLRGFRIELDEIEIRLRQCDGVRDAIVIARVNSQNNSQNKGHSNEKHLVAYVKPQPNTTLIPAELRQQLALYLAEYMLPSAFVVLESFPLTTNGKVDRQALPPPDQDSFGTRHYEKPIGNIETTLAEIWQALLRVEKVGRYDHFFELGGHSLLAVQLTAHVRRALKLELALQQIFTHPILTHLAALLTDTSIVTQATVTQTVIPHDVIPIVDRRQPLPLSFAQQRLLFLAQFDPAANLAYQNSAVLRFCGKLNHQAFIATLNRLVVRHEILRTRFVLTGREPYQQIDSTDSTFNLSYLDLRKLDNNSRQDGIAERLEYEKQTPFEFSNEPAIRGQLLQLADEEHLLILTQHHIISDGWSEGILIREMGKIYSAILSGDEISLPPLSVQYADYAVWQRQWLQGDILTVQLDFWRQQLRDAPALLTLPTDRSRPREQRYIGSYVPVYLHSHLVTALKELGQRHNITLFMVLLAGWSYMLARLSGQNDVVIGTPVANRQRAEFEELIGFFANTLPLRIKLASCHTVTELLAHTREQALAAYAHQDLPFEQMVEALQPVRSLSYSPLFQVELVMNNTPVEALALPGLSIDRLEQEHNRTHFDLTLSLTETGKGLRGRLEYSSDLFDHATVERMVGYLTNILTAMTADETQPLAHLPLLSAAERQQLLVDFSGVQDTFPQEAFFHQLFEAQVQNTPDAIAVVFEEQSVSYDELNKRANRLAHHLITLGVRPDDRVALCVESGPDMVVGLLAILKAGGAYVPLDPNYPICRLLYMLEDAKPVVLLTQALLTQHTLIETLDSPVPVILLNADKLSSDDAGTINYAALPDHNPNIRAIGLNPRHLAYVIYTSGSTGQPKGVMVEHHSLCNTVIEHKTRLALNPGSRLLQLTSSSFDACILECCMTLLAGARLYLARRTDILPGSALYRYLEHYAITHTLMPPSVLAHMEMLPDTLQALLVGGEACSSALVKRWAEKRQMFNGYGPSEAAIGVTLYPCDSQEESAPAIGRPIANTCIYLLDTEGQAVPIGVSGEIFIGGTGVARGYLNAPELTAKRFMPDPFSTQTGARMYKTGDFGRWRPDGNIEFLGRNDFQVKFRGFRIELGEIEARLVQCNGVHEAAVIVRQNEENQQSLVAYLLTEPNAKPEPAQLLQQLAQHITDYMIPSAFVVLDSFPLTPNGKLDRQALPDPDQKATVNRNYETPVNETEIILAGVWQELLGLETVGRYDHFFELGGHSLMAVSLIKRLRNLGLMLDIRTLFSSPILAEMAETIQSIESDTNTFIAPPNLIPENCTAITPDMLPLVSLSQSEIEAITATVPGGAANIQDIYPLSPLQEGILFHYLLETQGDVYLLRRLLAFDNRERLDAFLIALQQVIDRHDILRISLCWQELPQPVQIIWRQAPLHISTFEPPAPYDEQDVRSQLLSHTDPLQRRLDIYHAPLISTDITHDPVRNEWLLALSLHHLIGDHLTLEMIFTEIHQQLNGHPETPSSANSSKAKINEAMSYRDFIAHSLHVPPSFHETYFRKMLAGIDAPTAPFEVLNIHGEGKKITEARQFLDTTLSKAIRTQSSRYGIVPSVLFHVAWAQVLAHTSGRSDVVFGTVLLGRMQGSAGIGRSLGLFINTLPIRICLTDLSVLNVVQNSQRHLTELFEHEQASLALAQRCSDVVPPLPLFNSLLNYRHSQSGTSRQLPVWEGIRLLESQERTHYPIGLAVDDLGEEFRLHTQAVSDIDPKRLIGYMTTALAGLIEALESKPHQKIMRISILPVSERKQLLVDFNATQVDYPQNKLIHQLFEAQVQRTPDAIAVTFEKQSLSYYELNQRANCLAHHLMTLGVQPDDRIAICVERSLEMVIGLLGILKSGAAYLPLDPAYPAERLAYILEDATPVLMLTQTSLADSLTSSVPTLLLDIPEYVSINMSESIPADNPDTQALGVKPYHLAYVIYTSGSTGQPKGVMVEHHSLCNTIMDHQTILGFTPDSHILQFISCGFDVSLLEFLTTLVTGACLHMASSAELLPGPPLLHFLESHAITHSFLAPTTMVAMETLPDRLQTLILGGDVCTAALVKRWAPGRRLFNMYGPAEATICSAFYQCDSQEERDPPIGHPIANTQIYILDTQAQLVPIGITGEIYIAGAGISRVYLNRPDLTSERFLANPFSSDPSARMYKTGDLGYWRPDGNIVYLGRNDFQVKIHGCRIELGEIEARLMQCNGVREAAVLTREDEPDQNRLVAYIIPQPGVTLIPAKLRQQLARHLAEYMLPNAFVSLESFPLTATGKIDRQAFPAPDSSAIASRGYEDSIGETETALAEIWQELLKLERVGRNDHFFELGGHSLTAVQLVAHIHQVLARELPIQQLFSNPILSDLAAILPEFPIKTQIAIPIADRNQPLPLSFGQQRLWFLTQLSSAANLSYNIPAVLHFSGQLNLSAFTAAFDNLVARHEILRTRLVLVNEQPYQLIDAADSSFTLTYLDLQSQSEVEQKQRIAELVESDRLTPFNLSDGPLIRGKLIQLADDKHIFILTQHHIISDGWSMGILFREFSIFYQAALDGHEQPLSPLPIQYADYAVWQHKWMQEKRWTLHADFWRKRLLDAPSLLTLPTDRPRPQVQTYNGKQIPIHLDINLLNKLKILEQRHDSTLFMILLAAWSLVLSRLSSQDDIIIGTPVANRQYVELEGLIGFFINVLPLRVRLTSGHTVEELLAHVRKQTLAAYEHQALPFEQIVDVLQPVRSQNFHPLFQVMLSLNNTPSQHIELPDLSISSIEQTSRSALFDLTLSLHETPEGLNGYLEYTPELFEYPTIQRIAGYFKNVLTAFANDSKQDIAHLPMLPATELRQLLVDFNKTQADFPQGALIHELFEQQVKQTPEATAIVFNKQSLTYDELNKRANQLAHYLIESGVQPDDRIALCVARSPEMIVGLLAILKAGGAYVPLDPVTPSERLSYLLQDAAPVALLTQSTLKKKLDYHLPAILLDAPDLLFTLKEAPDSNPNRRISGLNSRHLAYVIYTSGSTGQPKGVMVEHHSLINLVYNQQNTLAISPSSRILQFASPGFDVCIWECCMALLSGASLCLAEQAALFPGSALLKTLETHTITHVLLPPITLTVMDTLPATLEMLVVGGEACPPSLVRRWADGWRMINAYGPTEITVYATTYQCNSRENSAPPIGRPIANTRIYILDANGQPVPFGVTGEIYIAGAGVARGYLNLPDLTAERFLPDPFSSQTGSRMYKTGDLGRWLPDGKIEYCGRNDFQIKLRGFRIELGEIESRLRQCPGVQEAIVLVLGDQPDEQKLVAYLLAEPDTKLIPSELRWQLAQYLINYMLPNAFVVLDHFPLTSNGKLDRQALPAPDLSAMVTQRYEAPLGNIETTLAGIWQELLKLEHIGRHDNFFELGGHSLNAAQLLARMREQGMEVTLPTLFTYPTLSELAIAVSKHPHPPVSIFEANPIPLSPAGDLPPLFFIHETTGNPLVYSPLATLFAISHCVNRVPLLRYSDFLLLPFFPYPP